MFGAIKGYFFGGSSDQNSQSSSKESKPLKSDVSNNNVDQNRNKEKKTIIKGEKNKFDFSEEYDEDEPRQSSSTSENSSSNENKDNAMHNDIQINPAQRIYTMDYWRMAHCVFVKNSLIDIRTIYYVPFTKIKKSTEGIFSYIGFGSEVANEVPYLVGFDENFVYMINLSKEENKDNNDTCKTVGNHYDITKISNIEIVEAQNLKNKILVTILFILDNDVDNYNSKIKKLYFEKKDALKFLKYLKLYLNMYRTEITYNDKVFGNINFNQIDVIQEEKIINTREIIVDDKKLAKDENNEEDKDKNKKEEKEGEKEEKDEEGKEEDKKEQKKEQKKEKDEEVFTDENVVENDNKNLIDI